MAVYEWDERSVEEIVTLTNELIRYVRHVGEQLFCRRWRRPTRASCRWEGVCSSWVPHIFTFFLLFRCSVDQFVLPTITYQQDLLAYVEAHVFKFADRAVLDFQCAISICIKTDGGCQGVTVRWSQAQSYHLQPPRCGRAAFQFPGRQRRATVSDVVNRTLPVTGAVDTNLWRLSAQRLTVIDLDDDIKSTGWVPRWEYTIWCRTFRTCCHGTITGRWLCVTADGR
jgi:hypothetical protein